MVDLHVFLFPLQKIQLKLHFSHITKDDLPYKPYKRGRFEIRIRKGGWWEILFGIKAFHFDSFLTHGYWTGSSLTFSLYQNRKRKCGKYILEGHEMVRYRRLPSLIAILQNKRKKKRR